MLFLLFIVKHYINYRKLYKEGLVEKGFLKGFFESYDDEYKE